MTSAVAARHMLQRGCWSYVNWKRIEATGSGVCCMPAAGSCTYHSGKRQEHDHPRSGCRWHGRDRAWVWCLWKMACGRGHWAGVRHAVVCLHMLLLSSADVPASMPDTRAMLFLRLKSYGGCRRMLHHVECASLCACRPVQTSTDGHVRPPMRCRQSLCSLSAYMEHASQTRHVHALCSAARASHSLCCCDPSAA